MSTSKTEDAQSPWDYNPSLPTAIIFVVIFAVLTVLHGWKMIKSKQWFCTPFFVGGTCKVALLSIVLVTPRN
jgi:hypothetical protein